MLEQPHEATPYPQPNPQPSNDGSLNTPNFDTDFPNLMKGGDDTVFFPVSQIQAFDQQAALFVQPVQYDPAKISNQENNVPQPVTPSTEHDTSAQQLFRYINGQDQPPLVITRQEYAMGVSQNNMSPISDQFFDLPVIMQQPSTSTRITADAYAAHWEGGIEDQVYGHAEPTNQVTDSDLEEETAVPTQSYLKVM